MKLTKETTRERMLDNLPSKVFAELSNWIIFSWYRSTLFAYLQRWYYKNTDDKIEYAIVKNN